MKASSRLCLASVLGAAVTGLLVVSGCSTPQGASTGGGTARVEFVDPEKFADVQLSDQTAAESRAIILPKIESYLVDQAARVLPAGHRLDVRILNLDEAGAVRLVSGHRMRIAPDREPARIELAYTLTDSSGKTLKSGHETLNSFGRPPGWPGEPTDELYTEKELLRRWLHRIAG